MRKNTRSRTAANARYRANLISVVHSLPDEVIAHIFVMGCPAPTHKLLEIDTAPLQYQVLVGSICRLWRKIANECPCLWTSVVVRHPFSKNKCPRKKLEFYEEMISVVLGRSGTLELDLSIRTHDVDRFSGFTHFDSIIPHLQRVHTLDVEPQDNDLDLIPLSKQMPELPKLRHLYVKAFLVDAIPSLPSSTGQPPFHCETFTSFPASGSTIPTSHIRHVHLYQPRINSETVQFVNQCNDLRVLELSAITWAPDVLISSSTLTHLDLDVRAKLQFLAPPAHGLPSLVHLRLKVNHVTEPPIDPLSWTPLSLLRSLSIDFGRTGREYIRYDPYLTDILRGAPQLVALQIEKADALEAIEFIRIHREEMLESGVKRAPLRILILTAEYGRAERWGDIPDITRITWGSNAQTEWHSQPCTIPIKIGDVEVSWQYFQDELSPPLSVRADEIRD